MTAPVGGATPAPTDALCAPALSRRMACFVYEAMLLFGLGLVPGALGALFFAQTGQRYALQSATALRVFAWLFYGLYFVWFWSARGQTLAMQTWHIGVAAATGTRVTQARAMARYVACCAAWFGPPTIAALAFGLPPWTSLALTSAWILAYALLARAAPQRQFWHDLLCGTRLVDTRGDDSPAWLRRRPR